MSTDVDNVKEAEIIVKINQIPIHWYLNCYLNDSINIKLKRIKQLKLKLMKNIKIESYKNIN